MPGAASVGGTLVIVRDALDLLHAGRAVTLINTVPSTAAALVQRAAVPAPCASSVSAGEPLSRTLVAALFAGRAGGARVQPVRPVRRRRRIPPP